MKARVFDANGFLPWKRDTTPTDADTLEVGFDDRLVKEIERLQAIIARLADREGRPIVTATLFDVIVVGLLIKMGMIEKCECDGAFILSPNFKRTPDLVVGAYLSSECATRLQQQGKNVDELLPVLIEPSNWDQLERVPHHLKPLVRKVQKELFGSFPEVRRMDLDVFWSIVRRRLVAEGFIKWQPHS